MGLSGSHWVLAAALAAAVLVTGVVYYTLRPRRDARSQPQALPTPPAPAAAVPAAAAVALSSVSAAVVPAAAAVLPAPEPAPPAVAVGGSLAPGRTAVPKAAAPAADKAERWSFEGRVYDLLSLKYVYSAELTFLGPKGIKSGVTETGETGRYRIKLDALPEGGYTLLIRHPDYKNRYIEDVSPSLRQISLDERKPLARFVPAPKQLFGKPGGTLRKDFALIPKTN